MIQLALSSLFSWMSLSISIGVLLFAFFTLLVILDGGPVAAAGVQPTGMLVPVHGGPAVISTKTNEIKSARQILFIF